MVGTIGIFTCAASAVILMIRDKVVASAEIALAGATTAIGKSQLLCVFKNENVKVKGKYGFVLHSGFAGSPFLL